MKDNNQAHARLAVLLERYDGTLTRKEICQRLFRVGNVERIAEVIEEMRARRLVRVRTERFNQGRLGTRYFVTLTDRGRAWAAKQHPHAARRRLPGAA
jgi:hypothetical protein